MNEQEAKRQHSLATKQGILKSQDTARAERLAEEIERMTTLREQPQDMQSKTERALQEMAERKMNAEGREETVASNSLPEKEALLLDTNFRRLADLIGLDHKDMAEFATELNILMGWAKKSSNSEDLLDALGTVKALKTELGFSEKGKTALKKLYQFVRLDMDGERIQKEKELLVENE